MTATGRGMTVLALTLAVSGTVLRYLAFLILAAGLTATVLVAAMALARTAALQATVTVSPDRVIRGQPVDLAIGIRNGGRLRTPRCTVDLDGLFGRFTAGVPALSGGGETCLTAQLPATRRGVFRAVGATATWTERLSLLRRRREVSAPVEIRVWPLAVILDPFPSARFRQLDGSAAAELRDGTVTFDVLREYVPGDDGRRIHWPSAVRTGSLMIRTFVDSGVAACTVVLDVTATAYPPGAQRAIAFENAVDAAASIVVSSVQCRYPVRLHAGVDLRWPSAGGEADPESVLDLLTEVQLAGAASASASQDELARAAAAVAAETARGRSGTLVIVTGSVDTGQLDLAEGLADRFEHTVLVRVDAAPQTGVGSSVSPVRAVRGSWVVRLDDVRGIAAAWQELSAAALGTRR